MFVFCVSGTHLHTWCNLWRTELWTRREAWGDTAWGQGTSARIRTLPCRSCQIPPPPARREDESQTDNYDTDPNPQFLSAKETQEKKKWVFMKHVKTPLTEKMLKFSLWWGNNLWNTSTPSNFWPTVTSDLHIRACPCPGTANQHTGLPQSTNHWGTRGQTQPGKPELETVRHSLEFSMHQTHTGTTSTVTHIAHTVNLSG